jgi:hypothetical protein
MRVAQQPVGALDAMAQVRAAAKASADLGQRQPRASDRGCDRFQQYGQAPTVNSGQQRRNTTL